MEHEERMVQISPCVANAACPSAGGTGRGRSVQQDQHNDNQVLGLYRFRAVCRVKPLHLMGKKALHLC